MNYSLTLLNLVCGGIILWSISQFIFFPKNTTDWGGVAIITLGLGGLLGLGIDGVIQFATKNSAPTHRFLWRNGLEILLLVGFYYYSQNHEKKLTIVIPNDYEGTIGIVYDFPDSEPLRKNMFTLHSEVELPKSGIFFTSSKMRKYKIVYKDLMKRRDDYGNSNGKGSWARRYSGDLEIIHKGHTFQVRIINIGFTKDAKSKIAECKQRIKRIIESSLD